MIDNLHLLIETMHGHIAVLAIALCFHPPVALRKARAPARGVRWSAYLATLFLTVTLVLGWIVYPEYRREVRQTLYLASRTLGLAFEVKEHIGTFAVALSIAGAVVTRMATTRDAGPALVPAIRSLYLFAGIMALISAVLGIWLATTYGFPYPLGD